MLNSIVNRLLIAVVLLMPLGADCSIKKIGTPFTKQYKRSDFNAGQQTWMVEEGPNGMMYFANNDGLLEFDGSDWKLYRLPNGTTVRALKSDGKKRIYAGGFNELGYFEIEEPGRISYHSMVAYLPEHARDFNYVWKIHISSFGIIFQSFNQMMIFRDDQVEVIAAPDQFHFSYYVNGELYVVDRAKGLLRFALGKLFPVVGTEMLKGKEIWGMLSLEGKMLLATSDEGVYLFDGEKMEEWNSGLSEILRNQGLFCLSMIDDRSIGIGTIQNGLLVCDLKGNVLQSINRDDGLQNNTVLCMNTDDFGNLWLGLDNGIDYLEINSPLSRLSYQYGISAGYAAIIHRGILYLGTNQGVYAADWDAFLADQTADLSFTLVRNTNGQVWTLQEMEGYLLCGHNNGTFVIEGYKAENISDVPGEWTYLPWEGHPGKLIAGTYSGLAMFELTDEGPVFSHTIDGFRESSREIMLDTEGKIWMSHGLKGIYRLDLNDNGDSIREVRFYDSSAGLPSDLGMTLFKYQDSIFIVTGDGLYRFSETEQRFRYANGINSMIARKDLRKLTTDRDGNIWYFTGTDAGVFRLQEDGSYLEISLPFKQLGGSFIGGFQFVYPYDEKNVFLGTESGFVHYDPTFMKFYQKPIRSYIRRVIINSGDSVLFEGMLQNMNMETPTVDYKFNNLHFFFSCNDYENPGRTEFSTFLNGYDEQWTTWNHQNNREFTNLPEGDYIFNVRSKNIYDVESPVVSYLFSVRPPWRRSLTALILYIFIFLGGMLVLYYLIRLKIKRSKRKAEAEKERQFIRREEELKRETLEAEKEIIRLRNEKLREEMIRKDKELANSTLEMIQKNKLLVSLNKELMKLSSESKDTMVKSRIRSLIKKVNRDIDNETQWKVFETHFENVHEEFLQRIKAEFPDLTPRELKLCAYLRMNISSKEISLLMNISTRGVEISRYRLRKKLGLDRKDNLTDFILSY